MLPLGTFVGLVAIGAIVGDPDEDKKSVASPTMSATTAAPVQTSVAPKVEDEPVDVAFTTEAPKPVVTTVKPAPPPEPVKTKAPPRLTADQERAVDSAHDYLDYSGFSEKGLTKQLEFEGYSKSDAKYGATHAGADWNAEAAESAESYLEYSSFSRKGLLDQLKFEGYTTKQAQHGVDVAY